MVMKIKLLLLLLLLRVRSKKNNTGGGGKEHTFLSEYGFSTECPSLMRRGLQYSSPRVRLVGTVGVFSVPPPPPQWFLRVFMSEAKQGGGGGAKRFVRNMGTARGVPAKCDEDCR